MQLIAEGCAHHDVAAWPLRMCRANHIDAGTVRQSQIDQQHIGLHLIQHLQTLRPRASHTQQRHIRRCLNRLLQRILETDIVLHQRNADWRTAGVLLHNIDLWLGSTPMPKKAWGGKVRILPQIRNCLVTSSGDRRGAASSLVYRGDKS